MLDATDALDLGPDAVIVLDTEWRCTLVNAAAERLLGKTREECTGRTLWEIASPWLGEAEARALRRVMEERTTAAFDWRDAPNGRWLDVRVAADRRGMVITGRDVGERRRAQDALIASERHLRAILETQPEGVMLVGHDGRILQINRAGLALFEAPSPASVLGLTAGTFVTPEHLDSYAAAHEAVLAGESSTQELEIETLRGTRRWLSVSSVPLRDAAGGIVAMLSIARDITGRKLAEEALRASEERYRLVTRATKEVVYDWDLRTNALALSDAVFSRFRYDPGSVRPEYSWWEENVHPEDRARVTRGLERVIAGGGEVWEDEYRFRRGDRTWATVAGSGYVMRDAQGAPVRLVGTIRDLTARKALEEQLRQAQKLEAVGRLAGGIAHDFNNILTAISSNAELARAIVPRGSPAREDLDEIRRAIARGSALTRQLLAFGRRQVLQPRVLDLNEVVLGAERLLTRLVTEDIQITLQLDQELWPVRADPGQLEQVLMNLVVNARDAMPHGGLLVIHTSNATIDEPVQGVGLVVEAGDYVRLEVRDSGVGMDAATRARLFEPFFTTKAHGRGTGLGLATVYGIVEQSGGMIEVQSEPERGSAFCILLPRADQIEGEEAQRSGLTVPERRPSETVLLVEDEEAVRSSLRRLLERSGFRVVEARDGLEALEVWEREGAEAGVDLVLSDVVMPRLGGRELLEELRSRAPGARVLLMSGYTADTHAVSELLGTGAALIEKPFAIEVLLARVRQMLGKSA
ncbi:MAG TPA: PAS domain S-box protein [Gemmatimonadaceae bacterium]